MYDLQKLCLCIDIDGFRLQDKSFIVRELGWCDGDVKRVGTFHYDHEYRWEDMSTVDLKTIQFVKHRVTGLPFRPSPTERIKYSMRTQEDVEWDVLALWNRFKTFNYNVVAYKGGN